MSGKTFSLELPSKASRDATISSSLAPTDNMASAIYRLIGEKISFFLPVKMASGHIIEKL